ncbi:unnamed protein product [Auanema sp. JU1783]|nr:unnamed protein product [Auanema sp. JU1783]
MFSDNEMTSNDGRMTSKKTNKPLMEKKRRARINHCLSELKEMLIMDKHNLHATGHAKWEKADILEMTVEYVKKLRAARGLADVPTIQPIVVDDAEDSVLETKMTRQSSPAPSTSSTESVSERGHTPSKRARLSTCSTTTCSTIPPTSTTSSRISSPTAFIVSPQLNKPPNTNPTILPHIAQPSPLLPVSTPTVLNSNLGFMAQQLMFLHQHNMKMASTAPTFLPSASLPTPIPIMPWRPI